MTAQEMIRRRRAEWLELEQVLAQMGRRKRRRADPAQLARFAALFRSVCADLARARAQGFSDDLVDYLNALAARGHNAFYVTPPRRSGRVLELFRRTLPLTLHRNRRYLIAAVLLFFVPLCAFAHLGFHRDPLVFKLIPRRTLQASERMHSRGHQHGRSTQVSAAMAGYYVRNNIGIAFRCFAGGMFLGVGTLLIVLFNGVLLGAVIGFVAQSPSGDNILAFVVGHGPFELFAIALSAAAGLRLGFGALVVGNRRRRDALRDAAADAVQMVVAAALLLLGAALTEGFFSPSSLPVQVKVAYGALCALGIALYFGVYPALVARRVAREQPAAERPQAVSA